MAILSSPTNVLPFQSQLQGNTATEKWASLVLLPITGTLFFYLLPNSLQQQTIIQFIPQLLAYMGFGIWACANTNLSLRLGIQRNQLWSGVGWGCLVGLILGMLNTAIILKVIPAYGRDITFLAQTPHAQIPTLLMIPWIILAIAVVVEFNFRGFLLGRLIMLIVPLGQTTPSSKNHTISPSQILAIILSAFLFAFDPFMVATFQHLHWIAVWDGIIWGWIWVRFRNLYTVIAAHAIEVIVMYTCIRMALT